PDEVSEFATPPPVVAVLEFGTSVSIIIEFGPITIVTGSPFLSFALTRNDPGTILTFVKPSCWSFARISLGRFWVCEVLEFVLGACVDVLLVEFAAKAGAPSVQAIAAAMTQRANIGISSSDVAPHY